MSYSIMTTVSVVLWRYMVRLILIVRAGLGGFVTTLGVWCALILAFITKSDGFVAMGWGLITARAFGLLALLAATPASARGSLALCAEPWAPHPMIPVPSQAPTGLVPAVVAEIGPRLDVAISIDTLPHARCTALVQRLR